MALPIGVDGVTVQIGRYTSQAGSNEYQGEITFTPSGERLHIPTGTPMPADPIKLQLASGQTSVTLAASDALDCTATDITYTVVYNLRGPGGPITVPTKIIYLTRAVAVVDLELMSPVTAATPTGVSLPYVLSVAGLSGAVDAQALAALLEQHLTTGSGGGGGGGGGSGSTAPEGGWQLNQLSTEVQTLLGEGHDAVRLGGVLGGTNLVPALNSNAVPTAAIQDAAVTLAKLAATVQTSLGKADTAVQPGAVVTSVNGQTGDVTVSSSGTVGDATTSAKGIVQLSATDGGIGGTATALAVNGWGTVVRTSDSRLTDARTPTTHAHAAADITSGVLGTARLGTGTADNTRFLRGDGTWSLPPSGGSSALTTLTLTGAGPHTFSEATWQAKVVEINSSATASVVMPSGASGGAYAHIVAVGAGQVAVSAGSGASVTVPAGRAAATRGQYSQITVRRRDDPGAVTFPTTNLLARWKAADLPSSGAIASWAADTGGVALAQGTTAAQPAVETIGTAAYKSAKFDGSGDFFNLTGDLLNLATDKAVMWVYAVLRFGGAVSGARSIMSMAVTGTAATNTRFFFQRRSNSTWGIGGRRDDGSASDYAAGGTSDTNAHLVVAKLDFLGSAAEVWVDGATATPADTTSGNPNTTMWSGTATNSDTGASNAGTVGANYNGTTEYFWGNIIDLGVFGSSSAFTLDRAQLGTALQNTYPGLFTVSDYLGSTNRWHVVGDLAASA